MSTENLLVVLNNCRTIEITKGKNTLINEEDLHIVGVRPWHVLQMDTRASGVVYWYACRTDYSSGKRKDRFLHRDIMGDPKGMHVDHKNGDQLDNRRENLRACERKHNQHNTQSFSGGSSRYKGVCYDKRRGLWEAYIWNNNKKIPLGRYKEEVAAARAYDEAAIRLFGEFAFTNNQKYGDLGEVISNAI